MLDVTLHIYAISIQAFRPRLTKMPDGSTVENFEGWSTPAVLVSSSMIAAAAAARDHALERWPVSEGWYAHTAVIQPLTKPFLDQLLDMVEAKLLFNDNEDPQSFDLASVTAEVSDLDAASWVWPEIIEGGEK